MSSLEAEARRLARSPSRVAEPLGPGWLQLEAVERLEFEYDDVQLSDWFPHSGDLYVDCLQAGRRRARFRITEEGRAIPERIWS